MVTRLKDDISKPKKLYVSSRHPPRTAFLMDTSHAEPTCYTMAAKSPKWRAAMAFEFDALQQNGTWPLVLANPRMNIVGFKWVYKLKYRADGSIEHYKARPVAKSFHQ